MFIEKETREELNKLSKEVFGVSSKWQGLLEHGVKELVTETKTETIPGENGKPDETREIRVPIKKNGVPQYAIKRYNLDEVRELMLNAKKSRDEYIERMKKAQELAQIEKKVNEVAQGRVVG
jgi:hypothetical protein